MEVKQQSNEILEEKKKALIKKFFIKKEYLNVIDMAEIIDKMNFKDDNQLDVNEIFQHLDINKDGKISVDEFATHLVLIHNDDEPEHKKFFEMINKELVSKSEIILMKLKRLKSKVSDMESLDDIDWIINALNDDIHELDFDNALIKSASTSLDNEFKNTLDFIAQFSNAPKKEESMKNVLRESEKKLTTTQFFKNNSLTNLNDTVPEFIKRHEERMSQTLSDLSAIAISKLSKILFGVNSFDFDIFELNGLIGKKTLFYLSSEIFNRNNYFDEAIDEQKFKRFTHAISEGYNRNVPYHNDLHAGDVMQTVYVMLEKSNLFSKMNLTDIDVIATLTAAMCHDFRHNGYNNFFHINNKTHIAITYNDASVLENFHVAESFKIIIQEEYNLFSKLTPEEFRHARRRMIDCILATDMTNHSKHLSNLKTKLDSLEIRNGKNIEKMVTNDNLAKTFENQQLMLGVIVHTADISNPAKPVGVNQMWVELVFKEFFHQGDQELLLGQQISILCDRKTTNITKSQIGFINFVVAPTFETLLNIIPEIQPYHDNIKTNLRRFEMIVAEEDKKKETK